MIKASSELENGVYNNIYLFPNFSHIKSVWSFVIIFHFLNNIYKAGKPYNLTML